MKTRILHSYGNREIEEYDFVLGEMSANQMLIESVYTGICRSDIDQYTGKIAIPFGHFGHESLGRVVKIGRNIKEFQVGDLVASRCDPAFSKWFYADEENTVHVDSISPNNIIEPIACSVNIALQVLKTKSKKQRILFVGTGFVSNITAQYIKQVAPNLDVYVIGSHNKEQWNRLGAKFVTFDEIDFKFKTIVELSGKSENYEKVLSVADAEAVICLAASMDKPVTTNFWNSLWQNHTYIFPSPRTSDFKRSMRIAANTEFDLDWVWTHEYDAKDFKRAFAETETRTGEGPFIRSYLKW